MSRDKRTVMQRINDKVIVDDKTGCWVWVRAYTNARDSIRPALRHKGRTRLAYRVVYEEFNNVELDSDQFIRHTCDNSMCVNPDHLDCGSHKDNMGDKKERNRQPWGENHYNAKLTEQDVIDIRYFGECGIPVKGISFVFPQVSECQIKRIIENIRWSNL